LFKRVFFSNLAFKELSLQFQIEIITNNLSLSRIDGTKDDGSLGRLINDSHKHPNCKPMMPVPVIDDQPRILFMCTKDIQPGVDVVYSYGDSRCGSVYEWRKVNNNY